MADIWLRIRAEREALAEILPGLTEEQWQSPSLCQGWTVRDVVAHMIYAYERETVPFFLDLVRNGFNIDMQNQRAADRIGAVSNKTLIARYNATVDLRNKIPVPTQFVLAETLIHNEDVLRALEYRRVVPIETALIVAHLYRSIGMARRWSKKHGYVELVASDANWRYGEGDVATGPLLSIVLLLADRESAARDLEGAGARRLRSTDPVHR